MLDGSAPPAPTERFKPGDDAVEEPVVITLDGDGRVTSWNPVAERSFQYAAEEIIGRLAAVFYEDADIQRGAPQQALALAAAAGRHYEAGPRVRRDGSVFRAGFLYAADASSADRSGFTLVVVDQTSALAADQEIDRLSALVCRRTAEFEALLNVLPVGIGVAHDRQCRHIEVNRAFAEVLGLKPGQNASKTAPADERPTNFTVTDDAGNAVPDESLPMQVAAREGIEVRDLELNIVHADGRVLRLLEYAAPLRDEHGAPRGSVGAFVDITERAKIARKLHESEARFRQLVEAVEDYAIFMLDGEGRVSSWNNGASRTTGYAADEIVGRSYAAFFTEEERTAGKPQRILKAASEAGRYEEVGRRVRKDGSKYWANIVVSAIRDRDGAVRGFANVTRDVTERKRAEEMFRLAVQAAASAIILVNEQGKIAFANTQAQEMFGYALEELMGSSLEMLLPERFREVHRRHRASFLAKPAARDMGESRDLYARRKDGSEFPVEVELNPIETDEGLMTLTSILDITARKLATLREREQLAQLAHAGRLSSLGEMVSELTHEINQPLAAATNYARAFLRYARGRQGGDGDELIGLVDKCVLQMERAGAIVKRLNDFVRKSPPAQTPIDLNRTVRDMIALTAPGYSPEGDAGGVHIETVLGEALPQVLADRVQIEQVIVNLIRNALDAMRGQPAAKRVLRFETAAIGDEVRVSVADRGAGIAPQHAPRLFEPFYTTKPEGVGLGLPISRTIIEAHGGRIWAEPQPGGGAVFHFTLPIASEPSRHATADSVYR